MKKAKIVPTCLIICSLLIAMAMPWVMSNIMISKNDVRAHFRQKDDQTHIITSAEGLQQFANEVNSGKSFRDEHILLEADIILNDNLSIDNDNNDAKQWIPIGSEQNPFEGSFDGGGHFIKGLYIHRKSGAKPNQTVDTTIESMGLFGRVSNGSIKNVIIQDALIISERPYSNVGTVVGHAYNASVSECKVFGAVNIKSYNNMGGGIVGYSNANQPSKAVIERCEMTGDIIGSGIDSFFGGVVGKATALWDGKGLIKDCVNNSNIFITGVSPLRSGCGGIVGVVSNFDIYDVTNKGSVVQTSRSNSGGIIGEVGQDSSKINIAGINYGDIKSDRNVGGIVGYSPVSIKIMRSINMGHISAELDGQEDFPNYNLSAVGGIIGRVDGQDNKSKIIVSINYGNIKGYSCGGIIGAGSQINIEGVWSTGSVDGIVAGAVGGNVDSLSSDYIFVTEQLYEDTSIMGTSPHIASLYLTDEKGNIQGLDSYGHYEINNLGDWMNLPLLGGGIYTTTDENGRIIFAPGEMISVEFLGLGQEGDIKYAYLARIGDDYKIYSPTQMPEGSHIKYWYADSESEAYDLINPVHGVDGERVRLTAKLELNEVEVVCSSPELVKVYDGKRDFVTLTAYHELSDVTYEFGLEKLMDDGSYVPVEIEELGMANHIGGEVRLGFGEITESGTYRCRVRAYKDGIYTSDKTVDFRVSIQPLATLIPNDSGWWLFAACAALLILGIIVAAVALYRTSRANRYSSDGGSNE